MKLFIRRVPQNFKFGCMGASDFLGGNYFVVVLESLIPKDL